MTKKAKISKLRLAGSETGAPRGLRVRIAAGWSTRCELGQLALRLQGNPIGCEKEQGITVNNSDKQSFRTGNWVVAGCSLLDAGCGSLRIHLPNAVPRRRRMGQQLRTPRRQ